MCRQLYVLCLLSSPMIHLFLLPSHVYSNPNHTNAIPLNPNSIREFCPLTIPIFMYDKDGSCVVKTLEEVSLPLVNSG